MSVFDLWLPILLTGIATHVASFIAWMVLPHHKPEWKKLPVEDDLLDFLDEHHVPAEQFLFPFCDDPKQMGSPEFVEKMNTRCRGYLVLWPQPPSMGKSIGLTLGYFFVAAFLIGYIASIAFMPGEVNKMQVFALTFTAGILCHALSPFPAAFWFPQKVAMQVADGVVFALITAALFTWLWPAAV
jgi:hypothetical protein